LEPLQRCSAVTFLGAYLMCWTSLQRLFSYITFTLLDPLTLGRATAELLVYI
jgi:hypothetical protein